MPPACTQLNRRLDRLMPDRAEAEEQQRAGQKHTDYPKDEERRVLREEPQGLPVEIRLGSHPHEEPAADEAKAYKDLCPDGSRRFLGG
ncbi:MAG: hypothetical protein ABW223_12780 [Rariglobus sp.]